jgi:hypothetical protein
MNMFNQIRSSAFKITEYLRALKFVAVFTSILAATSMSNLAHAVPSYARQTGAECAACHVGSYGPHLTPFGIRFKIGGYVDSDGGADKRPVSAMVVVNSTQTSKNASEADTLENFKPNHNTAMQEASLFLAGRLFENVGSFVQATYSGIERKWGLDQLDVRYARNLNIAGQDTTLGLSLNNNPTLTDPFHTLGQWRFPYTASDFNAGFGPAPLMESLGGAVWGANAYAMVDDHFYGEFGLYNSLSAKALKTFNGSDAGAFKGLGQYGRLAYFQDNKRDNFSVGVFGFTANVQPDRTNLGIADRYVDYGVDAAYQFLGNRKHIVSVNSSYTWEKQKLNFTNGVLDEADFLKNNLKQLKISTAYNFNNTWGATLGLFNVRGGNDALRYSSAINGSPTTQGYTLQADWTPWGKEGAWGSPLANVRFGLQYTGYQKFMGGSTYLDGSGNVRRASDNNTTMLFLWTAI